MKQRLKSILVEVVLFVMIAANVELFALILLWDQGYEKPDGWGERNPLSAVRFRANVKDEIYLTNRVTTNSDGLRNEEITGPPEPGELRVLCLGDSLTFGTGLENPDTYPRILEKVLRAQAPKGVNIRVINAGQPGFMAYRAAGLMEDLWGRYRPQVVTAMFGYNDSESHYIRERKTANPESVDRLRGVLYHSATYRYLCSILQPAYEPAVYASSGRAGYPQALEWYNCSAANLLYIHDFVKEHGAKLLIVAEAKRKNWKDPHGYHVIDDIVYSKMKATYLDLGRRNGVPVIVMDDFFARTGKTEAELFQENPVHTTPLGSTVLADVMANELWRQGWIPRASR